MNPTIISIILPSYNERENLIRLIPSLRTTIRRRNQGSAEIIVVDDNSPDGTATALRQKFGNSIKLVVRKNERGLATAILRGINEATGTVIVGMDADGNHDPRSMPSLLDGLRTADLVVGSRFVAGGSMNDPIRYVTSRWFNRWLSHIGFPVLDATSGYYAVRKSALAKLPLTTIYRGYGEYHMRLVWYAKKCGLRIAEIPVRYGNRRYGQSKSRFLIMLGTYTKTALRLVRQ
ncbi:MAG: glycosyltransferase [Patescibacteria group bacterium]